MVLRHVKKQKLTSLSDEMFKIEKVIQSCYDDLNI